AKILDFGIAKATAQEREATSSGTLKGKFSYVAPEQVAGPSVRPRTDIFSCSLSVYELLCGVNPNRTDSAYDSLLAVSLRDVPDIRQHRDDVPPEVAKILTRGLARDPTERYRTAHDMARDLRDVSGRLGFAVNHGDV